MAKKILLVELLNEKKINDEEGIRDFYIESGRGLRCLSCKDIVYSFRESERIDGTSWHCPRCGYWNHEKVQYKIVPPSF